MINYLSEEEIVEINKISLELTQEHEEFHVMQSDDIRFIVNFVKEELKDDIIRKSLAYCVSIIVLHPFKNGNHRTSLMCAERLLLKNNFRLLTSNKEKIEIEKWRMKYEEKHDLQREFFRITNIENEKKRKEEINNIMNSSYGKTIEKWFKENYKKN